MTPRLILASASPRRSDVLTQLGLDHVVLPAAVDESYLEGETPTEQVERLARSKATAVTDPESGSLVIGGDTVAVGLEGRDQSMSEYWTSDRLDVVGGDVQSSFEDG